MSRHTIDLTGVPGFRADGPAAMHHPIPLEEVRWSMIWRAALFLGAIAVVGGLIAAAGLSWVASQVRHQPSAATSISSVPQASPYSRGAV